MKKRFTSIIFVMLMICTMMPFATLPVFAATADSVEYYSWNEKTEELERTVQDGCVIADNKLSVIGKGHAEWVVVKDVVRIGELDVQGEANIILAEGGELITEAINYKGKNAQLHIYGTSKDGKSGTLRITKGNNDKTAINLAAIELCGGSLIVEEGWEFGIIVDNVVIHGGYMSVFASYFGVTSNHFVITGGSANIISIADGDDTYGIVSDVAIEGGELRVVATFDGINGNVNATGGTLDVLSGGMCVDQKNVLTFNDNIERIHMTSDDRRLRHKSKDTGVMINTACYYIAGEHENTAYFSGGSNGWTQNDIAVESLPSVKEILFIPDNGKSPNFSPYLSYDAHTVLHSNNPYPDYPLLAEYFSKNNAASAIFASYQWVIIAVVILAIVGVAVLVFVKNKKKTTPDASKYFS